MPELRAFILDFDGLIVETEASCFASWQALFASYGQTYTLEEFQKIIGSHASRVQGAQDPRRLLEEKCGRPLDWGVLEGERLGSEYRRAEQLPLQPGIASLLDRARARGLKLGVASSSSHRWVDGHLARTGILGRFDAVVCRGDAPRVKPDPDLYVEVVRRLGVQPREVVAFEDSHNGALAARRAGLWCVAVPTAMTATQDFSHAHLRLPTLEGLDLDDLTRRLAAAPRPAPVQPVEPGDSPPVAP